MEQIKEHINLASLIVTVSELKLQLIEDHQDLKEEAANNDKDNDVQMQQLLDKLTTEESLRLESEAQAMELELELSQKDLTVHEARTKAAELGKKTTECGKRA